MADMLHSHHLLQQHQQQQDGLSSPDQSPQRPWPMGKYFPLICWKVPRYYEAVSVGDFTLLHRKLFFFFFLFLDGTSFFLFLFL